MRPLVFLFTRSFVNGVKRSVSSPKRAIGLIFFACYYYFLIIRSFVPTEGMLHLPAVKSRFEMPPPEVISGVIFFLFAFASVCLMPGVATIRGGFRPADVDVLFPTPVNPKIVLVFRILRDYLLTLVAPLILGLIGWRGASVGLTAFIHNYPVHSMDMMRAVWLAWMLMSLGWISLGYGLSLFVGRSDLRSDRNQRIIQFVTLGLVLIAIVYIGETLHQDLSWRAAMLLTHSLLLEIIFLPATIATDLAMGSLEGNYFLIGVAVFGLGAIVALGFTVALTQVGWLYDQAAAKGFNQITIQRRRAPNVQYQLAAERARKGKAGKQLISKRLSKWTTTGALGLVWKEQLIQLRGPMAGAVVTFTTILAIYAGLAYVVVGSGNVMAFPLIAILLPCIFAYLLATINGFGGFGEMLKKVDILKPLPFSPSRVIFFEALAKAPIPAFMLFGGTLLYLVIVPSAIAASLAGLILGLGILVSVLCAILIAFVLFPDFEDPTQRGLGGIVMLLAEVICSVPGLALYTVLVELFHFSPLVSAIPSSGILLLISLGVAKIAGVIYADYNPSE